MLSGALAPFSQGGTIAAFCFFFVAGDPIAWVLAKRLFPAPLKAVGRRKDHDEDCAEGQGKG